MTELSKDFFSSLRVTKRFTENANGPTTNLDFDSTGEFLVTACESDDSILLYNCTDGENKKIIHSKKYGVGTVRFAHRSTTVIYTSTKGNSDDIRYLSMHDNSYLRYFKGHNKRVTQLELSPLNDSFISVAPEEALCMWDCRSAHMQGKLALSADSNALAAFDPQGLVFAVASQSRFLRLYDARNWERGAFAVFELTGPQSSSSGTWSGLQFSPDGKEILVTTSMVPQSGASCPVAYLLDSFDGNVKSILEQSVQAAISSGLRYTTPRFSFTPDSRFILGGRSDGVVSVWTREPHRDSLHLPVVEAIEGANRNSAIRDVAFNPKLALMATSGDSTCFYI